MGNDQPEMKTEEMHERAPATPFEPPLLTVLGDVVDLTTGSTSNDTADLKAYYY